MAGGMNIAAVSGAENGAVALPAQDRPTPLSEAPVQLQAERQETPLPSPEKIEKAAQSFGVALEQLNEGIRVEFDSSTDRYITRIVNRETNEVVRQIPPEELIETIRRLRDFVGMLLDIEI